MSLTPHKHHPAATTRKGEVFKAHIVVMCVVAFSVCLTGCGKNLAKSAKPLVTSIIAEQMGGGAECVNVTLGKEFADDRYHATAVLSNGNELKIVIHDQGDQVEVTIPTQQ